jgi:transposase
MLHLSANCNYYLYCGITDMRKGFDSLSGLVLSQMQINALSGSVFIFLNKKYNQVKLLLWEGNGCAL